MIPKNSNRASLSFYFCRSKRAYHIFISIPSNNFRRKLIKMTFNSINIIFIIKLPKN